MARRRREKSESAVTKLLPMQLRIGDRLGRPFTTAGGKAAHARVKKISQPDVTEIRSWGAHERVSVKRATAEEGKAMMRCVLRVAW